MREDPELDNKFNAMHNNNTKVWDLCEAVYVSSELQPGGEAAETREGRGADTVASRPSGEAVADKLVERLLVGVCTNKT